MEPIRSRPPFIKGNEGPPGQVKWLKQSGGWIGPDVSKLPGYDFTHYIQKGSGATTPWKVAKMAEWVTKKVIPSARHVFKRFWKGDIAKRAFVGPTGITSKKFWTRPKKGTVIRLVKNLKTGKYENVYG